MAAGAADVNRNQAATRDSPPGELAPAAVNPATSTSRAACRRLSEPRRGFARRSLAVLVHRGWARRLRRLPILVRALGPAQEPGPHQRIGSELVADGVGGARQTPGALLLRIGKE